MMQQDSLILAFGDHGALRKGGHGGGTKEELEAGLFAHSGKGFTFRAFAATERLGRKEQYLFSVVQSKVNMSFLNRDTFCQIDIVPTMATIFNIPIPYGNLGVVVPELLHYPDCGVVGCFYELFMAHVVNYLQVANYVSEFVRISGELPEQKDRLEDTFIALKNNIVSVLDRYSRFAAPLEQSFLRGNRAGVLSESERSQYVSLVGDMFIGMQKMREELEHNSPLFKSQWNSLNTIYMYSNVVIASIVILIMVCGALVLYLADRTELGDFLASPLASGYTVLILVVLFAGTLCFSPVMNDLSLVLTYIATAVLLFSMLRLCMKRWCLLRTLLSTKEEHISATLTAALVLIQSVAYTTLIMEAQERSLTFSLHTGLALLLILLVYKGLCNITTAAVMASTVLVVRFASEFPTMEVAQNFAICSAAPSAIMLVAGLFWTERNCLRSVVRATARRGFQILFTVSFIGMLYYQYRELDGEALKWNRFNYIVLPRAVYAINIIQVAYLFFAGCRCRPTFWLDDPPKQSRVYAFFTLLLLSILPSSLMIFGPYQPVLFLGLFVVLYATNFCLRRTGEANSVFQYVLYSMVAQMMFHTTGHVLDFVSPKVQRTFVGFPEFNTAVSFTIAFLDSVGVFTFTTMMTPILTLEGSEDAQRKYYDQITPSRDLEQSSPQKESSAATAGAENHVAEAAVAKNLIAILIHSEATHTAVTRFLAANFDRMFFEASHPEFTLRFFSWYEYILVLFILFVIGKL